MALGAYGLRCVPKTFRCTQQQPQRALHKAIKVRRQPAPSPRRDTSGPAFRPKNRTRVNDGDTISIIEKSIGRARARWAYCEGPPEADRPWAEKRKGADCLIFLVVAAARIRNRQITWRIA